MSQTRRPEPAKLPCVIRPSRSAVRNIVLGAVAGAFAWVVFFELPPSQRAAGAPIRGTVVDNLTGAPVDGADIHVQASLTESTMSDVDGNFTLVAMREPGEVVVVAATKPGYFSRGLSVLAGDSGIAFRLDAVPLTDDPQYVFRSPEDCRLCHQRYYDEWQDAGHRNAAKNTWVKDLYDGSGTPGTGGNGYTFKGAHPELHGDCAECHAPVAAAPNPGDHTDFAAVSGEAYEFGVSCDLCHKASGIIHEDLPGVLAMTMSRSAPDLAFGTLPDAAPLFPGQMRASRSELHASSLLCSACHEDNSDHDFDGDYLEEGSVESEATYSEWSDSPYAQPGPGYRTCQSCHMGPNGATTAAESFGVVVRDPSQLHAHEFQGTTDDYVKNAATVRVIAIRSGSRVEIHAAVTNDRTGHKVPSGVTTRNMILLVDATSPDGVGLPFDLDASETVPVWAGSGDPGAGYYAGLPGRGFTKVLTDGVDDNVFFTEATAVKSDNRIPAGATDWSSYVVDVPEADAAARVDVRLIYRRAFRAIVDLKGWVLTGQGRLNPDLIGPDFGVRMGDATLDVPMSSADLAGARFRIGKKMRIDLAAGAAVSFADGSLLELTDATGAWVTLASPPKIGRGGTRLVQKGRIGEMTLADSWPDGAIRFLRVSDPSGRATVVRLRREGPRLTQI